MCEAKGIAKADYETLESIRDKNSSFALMMVSRANRLDDIAQIIEDAIASEDECREREREKSAD